MDFLYNKNAHFILYSYIGNLKFSAIAKNYIELKDSSIIQIKNLLI